MYYSRREGYWNSTWSGCSGVTSQVYLQVLHQTVSLELSLLLWRQGPRLMVLYDPLVHDDKVEKIRLQNVLLFPLY